MRQGDSADVVDAHRHSRHNQCELAASKVCGCFHCGLVCGPRDIVEWIDPVDDPAQPGQTALCPGCGIDSLIGDQSGYPITDQFLLAMRIYWFS